jgi:hypothetical protein
MRISLIVHDGCHPAAHRIFGWSGEVSVAKIVRTAAQNQMKQRTGLVITMNSIAEQQESRGRQ